MPDGNPQWIDQTRIAVDRATNTLRAETQFEALTTAREDLDRILPRLAALRESAALGSGSWWAGWDSDRGLVANLDEARMSLERRKLAEFVRELNRLESRLREMIMASWKAHVASQAGDANELSELMKELSDAERIADIAQRLNEALGRLARLQRQLPDANALGILDEVRALFDDLERRLPAAVKTFISAASRGGASLDLLNAEVRGWLVDNGALRNFKVVPGRPQEDRHG